MKEKPCASLRHSSMRALICILSASLAIVLMPRHSSAAGDAAAKPSPLFDAMKTELDRSMKTLGAQDPAAYFIGYIMTDTDRVNVSGSNGALLTSDEGRNRWLEVSVRTGTYELDDTHKVDGRQPANGGPGHHCTHRR